MAFTMPTIEDGGCHYLWTDHLGIKHHICATLSIDPGWETLAMLATQDDGECLCIAQKDYFNPGDWAAEVKAAGGDGSWWMAQRDWINGVAAAHFVDHPIFPQLDNTAPITYQNTNIVAATYFHFDAAAGPNVPPVFAFNPFREP